jgi:ABC-type polysaccharide/polyol phosphate transport system ATPase subunit
MNEKAVIVKNLSKTFFWGSRFSSKSKKILALDDVTFDVEKGKLFAILGANGSGKTTLLRTIAGIYHPDSGIVKVNGRLTPILHIGTSFNSELTAKENVILSGMLLGIQKNVMEEKFADIIQFAELEDFTDMKLKHYSAGMKARLAFSTALQVDPDIILVDEVLAVGDRRFKEKSFQAFSSFKKKGKTILLVTHSLNNITKLADVVIILHKGKVHAIGPPEQIIEEYKKLNS